ncbi:hypothetical protein ACWOFR_10090 [Carnobacterium gallinarum]|uniref:hypothetical protein n=1 Tax=Carnobacterium gallinarum TaxID=2749 RepID=UPI0005573178|nr:hypothetical protein [Carnobacterium gallinarum]
MKTTKNSLMILIIGLSFIIPTVASANSETLLVEPEINPVSNTQKNAKSINIVEAPIRVGDLDAIDFELEQIYKKYYEMYPESENSNDPITFYDVETGQEIDPIETIEPTISSRLAMTAVNAKQTPYLSTANLHIYWLKPNNKAFVATGSGFYVEGNNVATAAHALYNKSAGGWATYASVAFGRNSATDYSSVY